MRRRSLLAALATAPFAASPPFAATLAAEAPMRVVASFSILADLTRQVGGSAVSVDTLVGPNQDVHIYDPRPKDLRTLMDAALLVRNGLGLEGWMDRLTGAADFRGKVVVAAGKVSPRVMREHGGAIATDPHAWQDPRNAILYVRAITDGLSDVRPANAAAWRAAADRFSGQIADADTWIQARLSPIPPAQRRIITTHDAFGYYGARYGIEFLSAEGISTEFEPSAKAIAALIRQIKREKVNAVFIENMTSPRMAEMLARETGARLGGTVYSDALSAAAGPAPTYLAMLHHNTALFAAAMKN